MEKQTVEFIKFLKHNYGKYSTYRSSAIAFMSKWTGIPIENYPINKIDRIIFEIFCDFIDHCDKPSIQLRQIKEVKEIYDNAKNKEANDPHNIYDCMLHALVLCNVRDDYGNYINGFKKRDFEEDTK